LLVDFDPVDANGKKIPAGISSTNEECLRAVRVAGECRDWLRRRGFPDPAYGCSGNGSGLLYRIDLPNDSESAALVSDALNALAHRFAGVDTTVFNSSRITKLYGTLACKGDPTPDRPHRVATLIDVPEAIEVVPVELLRALSEEVKTAAAQKTATTAEPQPGRIERSVAEMERMIEDHGIEVRERKDKDADYARRWVLGRCPFCGEEDTSAVLFVLKNGAKGFKCQHNRCQGKKWRVFKAHLGIETATNDGEKKSAADRLLDHADEEYDFWHSPSGDAYASPHGAHGNYHQTIVFTEIKRM